jgi:hypothetical protein
MKNINVKLALRTLEHIVLIALVAGAAGFYFGNQYGNSHIDLASVKQAQNTSK